MSHGTRTAALIAAAPTAAADPAWPVAGAESTTVYVGVDCPHDYGSGSGGFGFGF